MSLGFRMSGFFEPVAAVESNSKAAETYRANLRVEVIEKEVGKVDSTELLKRAHEKGFDAIDALVGGPPCRPFTTANKGETRWEKVREKNKGESGDAEQPDWFSFWKVIETLQPQPRLVIAENVMGLKNHGDILSKFLNRLRSSGYTSSFRELHSHCFGVPQNRKRIFIVGVRDFQGDPELILPSNPHLKSIKTVTVKEAISDLPKLLNNSPGSQVSMYKKGRPTYYQSLQRSECGALYDHITHSVHPVMAERFKHIPQGYSLSKAWSDGRIPEASMRSQYLQGNVRKQFSQNTLKNIHSNIYRRLKWDDVSCTITHVRKTVLIHPLQNRLISIREAARLQSFPDWFRFSGSISQQYQQIADAVPPLLARAIAIHLAELLMRLPKPIVVQQRLRCKNEVQNPPLRE